MKEKTESVSPLAVFLAEHSKIARKNNKIKTALYNQFSVKRGLRNSDGTGVLVGLTEIGDVHGYIVDEKEKVPVEGQLRYRGIEIDDIVQGCIKEGRHGFEEVAYLLLFNQLPDPEDLELFKQMLDNRRELSHGFIEDMILKAPSNNIMNKLARSILASYSYDKNPEKRSLAKILDQCIALIASVPTMVAYGYQAKSHYHEGKSLFIHRPLTGHSTAENFLHMIRPDGSYTRAEADILDLCLILHAEHGGGNNSAFTAHVVMSSDTDVYSAMSAAVGSLKGHKHGGANISVVEMMDKLKDNVKDWADEDEVAAYLTKIVKKEAGDRTGLIYGMGHAVYTLSDPRATILKQMAENLVVEKGYEEEFNLYKIVEKLSPGVFAKVKKSDKVISANVDFYSGLVYRMLGIPQELFTPIFAISRVAGWAAHIIEEVVSGGRIMRPAYKSVARKKQYIPLSER